MKKFKFLALILAAVFAVTTFASCSDDDDSGNDSVTLPSDTDNNGGSSGSGAGGDSGTSGGAGGSEAGGSSGSSSGAGGSSASGSSGATSTTGIPFDIKTTDTSNALGAALAKLGKGEVLPSGDYGNIKVGVYEYTGKYVKKSYGTERSAVRADEDTAYLTLKAETVEEKEGYDFYSDGGCIILNVKKGAKITITCRAALDKKNFGNVSGGFLEVDSINWYTAASFSSYYSDPDLIFSEHTFESKDNGECAIFNGGDTDIIISEIKVEY